jgi:hypothetical protein
MAWYRDSFTFLPYYLFIYFCIFDLFVYSAIIIGKP